MTGDARSHGATADSAKYAPDNLEQCCAGAQVRHEYNVRQYIMNGYPAGQPIQTGASEFYCNDCGKPLAIVERQP